MNSPFLPSTAPPAPGHVVVAPSQAHVHPVPVDQWPAWATAMALLKKDGEIGVGDTVYRVVGPATSKVFQAYYFAIFGKSCGCQRRHRDWNVQYPYAPPML